MRRAFFQTNLHTPVSFSSYCKLRCEVTVVRERGVWRWRREGEREGWREGEREGGEGKRKEKRERERKRGGI